MISKEKILENLKNRGVKIEKIFTDPIAYEKACDLAYKSIPIPWRWFIGKKKIKKILGKIKEHIS